MLGDIARQRGCQIIAQGEPLVVIVLKGEHALIRPIQIRQKLTQRLGIFNERRLNRLKAVKFEGRADFLQHAPHGGKFRRTTVAKPTRQTRLDFARGCVFKRIGGRIHGLSLWNVR